MLMSSPYKTRESQYSEVVNLEAYKFYKYQKQILINPKNLFFRKLNYLSFKMFKLSLLGMIGAAFSYLMLLSLDSILEENFNRVNSYIEMQQNLKNNLGETYSKKLALETSN